MVRLYVALITLMFLVGCDGSLRDIDNDLVLDFTDNCPLDSNPTQRDTDANGVGDFCDWDRFVRFRVTPEDLQGLRYKLHATFPTWYYVVGAIAFSVESYVPVEFETEFGSEAIWSTPMLFPPKTSTFTVYGATWGWDDWDWALDDLDDLDDDLLFTEYNEPEVDLGTIVFDQPQPPPTISLHGGSNVPGFEDGAVWYREAIHSQSAGLDPGGSTSTDNDGDGVSPNVDNCAMIFNPSQRDADDDEVGDACDFYAADPDRCCDENGVATEP